MRVIAGTARSLQLKTPKGSNTRPTLDRIKETLFNIINPYVRGAVFIDLFSGSGAIGIEALSRGAMKAYFVDSSKEAVSCIKENLKFTHLENSAKVICGDVFSSLQLIREETADIIFIDPPYNDGIEKKLFSVLSNVSFVSCDTLIILEASIEKNFEFEGFTIDRVKEYKTNKHIFLHKE